MCQLHFLMIGLFVAGYVIEGHVPTAEIRRLLTEQTDIMQKPDKTSSIYGLGLFQF